MINSARDDSPSEPIRGESELRSVLPSQSDSIDRGVVDRDNEISPSNGAQVNFTSELDALSISWNLAEPQPPHPSLVDEYNSISGMLATIAATAPMASHQALRADLHTTSEQLNNAQIELQCLHRQYQDRVDLIEAKMLEVKQLKFRTQQLARYSKNQIEKVQAMLEQIDRIRTEIVTSLDKFGGYEEIHSMLTQLEAARHALVIADEGVTTRQDAFYQSLQVIQGQVAAQSQDSEHKLHQSQELIQSLSQTISTDRLRIAGIGVELSTKLTDLHGLNAQITIMHAQVVEKSQTLQSRIAEIEGGFGALSQSVQQEKEQFYELTVEAIEKAEAIGSQFANIIKQMSADRDSIAKLTAEIESGRHTLRQETEQKLDNLDLRYHHIISTWDDFQVRQKDRIVTASKFSRWLWILSVAVGGISIVLIWILTILK